MEGLLETEDVLGPVVETVDLTPVLESLAGLKELMTVNQELMVFTVTALLILSGVVLGCTISLILAVTFK